MKLIFLVSIFVLSLIGVKLLYRAKLLLTKEFDSKAEHSRQIRLEPFIANPSTSFASSSTYSGKTQFF